MDNYRDKWKKGVGYGCAIHLLCASAASRSPSRNLIAGKLNIELKGDAMPLPLMRTCG